MSLASSRVGLRHRCTIERRTRVSDGAGGFMETWTPIGAPVPCRAWLESRDRSGATVIGDKVVEVEDRRVIVPIGTNVTDGDRIAQVTHRGAVLFDGPMPVDSVGRHTDHLELRSREVQ